MRGRIIGVTVAAVAVPGVALAIAAPNDPSYPAQTGPGGALAIIHEPQALATIGSTPVQDVVVATLDTGLDLSHPDLAPRLFSFAADVVVPDTGGKTAHAGKHGWDYIGSAAVNDYAALAGGDEDPDYVPPPAGDSHGTAVSGVLGAAWNDAAGGVGIAPNARFFALRTCWPGDDCPQYLQPYAIDFAASQGARVMSMSWNADAATFAAADAFKNHPNVLFATLAGGNGGPVSLPDNQRPCGLSVPSANANVDNVICVSTSSPADGLDCGGVSATIVDLAVPTQNSVTTLPGGGFGPTGCATSYASPTIAGAATVLFGLDPAASAHDVKSALVDSARPAAAWAGKSKTGGILDLDAAVKLFAQRRGLTLGSTTTGGGGTTGTTGTTGSTGTTGTSDTTRPILTASIAPKRFAVAGAPVATVKRIRRGASLTVGLSEPAAVTLALTRAVAGHRSGKRCVVGRPRRRGVKRCTASVAAPTIALGSFPKGTTKRMFSGRGPNGQGLRVGAYTASATARDATGNRSKPVALRFTIVGWCSGCRVRRRPATSGAPRPPSRSATRARRLRAPAGRGARRPSAGARSSSRGAPGRRR
jgi:hypothetical protein